MSSLSGLVNIGVHTRGTRRHGHIMESLCMRTTFVFLVALTMIQAACFLIVASAWRYRRHMNADRVTPAVCLNNETDIDVTKSGESNMIAEQTLKTKTHCVNVQHKMIYEVNQTVTKLYESGRLDARAYSNLCNAFEDPIPYTRLVGINGSLSQEGNTTLLWNTLNQSVTVPNISYITHLEKEGQIMIRQAGLYIVSSNLVIDVNASSVAFDTQTFIQYLLVLSHTYGSTRMLGEQRLNLSGRRQTSSYMKAVYELDRYDRLYIATTHMDLVDVSSKQNMFSVHFTRTARQGEYA
ncbi:uncharacterized protein LOC127846136 isoform X2 [Dreissena polymorpha]|uniref:uncharacterized protein LOC127846136 isoform X2 n=1 Tax=Dreissena polymorpha TaxID=45954 RepID=UPI0022645C12|nr:uncharacterized protein LOC127846136 isoform X2 [Dreissena polymorpha]